MKSVSNLSYGPWRELNRLLLDYIHGQQQHSPPRGGGQRRSTGPRRDALIDELFKQSEDLARSRERERKLQRDLAETRRELALIRALASELDIATAQGPIAADQAIRPTNEWQNPMTVPNCPEPLGSDADGQGSKSRTSG
jgi:hypothetical protein